MGGTGPITPADIERKLTTIGTTTEEIRVNKLKITIFVDTIVTMLSGLIDVVSASDNRDDLTD